MLGRWKHVVFLAVTVWASLVANATSSLLGQMKSLEASWDEIVEEARTHNAVGDLWESLARSEVLAPGCSSLDPRLDPTINAKRRDAAAREALEALKAFGDTWVDRWLDPEAFAKGSISPATNADDSNERAPNREPTPLVNQPPPLSETSPSSEESEQDADVGGGPERESGRKKGALWGRLKRRFVKTKNPLQAPGNPDPKALERLRKQWLAELERLDKKLQKTGNADKQNILVSEMKKASGALSSLSKNKMVKAPPDFLDRLSENLPWKVRSGKKGGVTDDPSDDSSDEGVSDDSSKERVSDEQVEAGRKDADSAPVKKTKGFFRRVLGLGKKGKKQRGAEKRKEADQSV